MKEDKLAARIRDWIEFLRQHPLRTRYDGCCDCVDCREVRADYEIHLQEKETASGRWRTSEHD